MGMFVIIIGIIAIILLIILIFRKKNQNNENQITENEPIQTIKQDIIDIDKAEFLHSLKEEKNIIGTIIIEGKQEDLTVEKDEETYIYYLANKVIGWHRPDDISDNLIIFKENTLENKLSGEIKDEIIQLIEKSKKREAQEKEREELEQKNKNFYEIQMGYQKSVVNPLGEKNKQKQATIKEMQKDREKVQKSSSEKQLKAKPEKVKNKESDITIKQEVEMDTMATDMDTIGKRLEQAGKIKGKEKEGTLAFVESDDLDNLRDEKGKRLQGQSSRYEAVLIDKKGNVRALGLENDTQEGSNPTEQNYQVKQNKNENVEKGDVLTRLQIQGQETIGIEKGQYGEVEVHHSHTKTIGGEGVEGNKSLDRQLETSNAKNPVEGTSQETQKLAQKYQDGYRSVEESYQEAEKHEDSMGQPCEELEVEDLDGNPHTVSHSHTDDIVADLMKNGEISDKFTEREIRERVEKAWNNKQEDMSKEEFKKDMEEDIEQDATNMRGAHDR